jgi:hypothetical protein
LTEEALETQQQFFSGGCQHGAIGGEGDRAQGAAILLQQRFVVDEIVSKPKPVAVLGLQGVEQKEEEPEEDGSFH